MILIWKPRCLNAKLPKCMTNASFYRLKFGTIDLMIKCWVGGHILTWWQSLSSCLKKNIIVNARIWTNSPIKVLGNCLRFPTKKIGAFGLLELKIRAEHWTASGLQDILWLLCCCYNLNLKTAFLNLGLSWKF